VQNANPLSSSLGSSSLAKNIANIQALRGVATLLVLLGHIALYENRTNFPKILPNWLFELGSAGVDLFFVISGYVMVTISGFGTSGLYSARSFLVRRACRIYPVYWFFSLLVLLVVIFQPNWIHREGGVDQINYLNSFLLIPDKANSPLVGQGWTLIHEMYFYIVFSLVVFASNRTRPYVILGWIVLLITSNWLFPSPTNPFLRTASSPLTFEFIFGCIIAALHKIGIMKFGRTAFTLGIFVLCANPEHLGSERVLWFGIPCTLIVYGAVAMEQRNQIIFPQWLRKTGDISYSIYLSHILVLSACLKVWKPFSAEGYFDNAIFIVMMIIAAWMTGFLVYRYLEHPIMISSKLLLKRLGL
jgi:peptidoglycan/LPS O-acetylase OafA/YrhL